MKSRLNSETLGPPVSLTILVVDDSQDDLLLLKLMLQRSRILNPLQSVNSVADAICYLKGEGPFADRLAHPFPGLIFIDLHLSDGSGFELLRWIQRNQLHAPAGVVVLSGSDVNAIKHAYELGAQSFLVKPLKFEDVRNMATLLRGLNLLATPAGYLLELA
ncbi:MAG TPA: response regulator [Bryobacteraceae bacterium]|nr:response regulator [Bryobacteraceae bacterium]